RLRPTRTMSPRRSTVTVNDGPSGTSASVVAGSDGGGWPCARAVAATASMAVPLMSARRPTTLGDVFCIRVLDALYSCDPAAVARQFARSRTLIPDVRD